LSFVAWPIISRRHNSPICARSCSLTEVMTTLGGGPSVSTTIGEAPLLP
jgi:hypothetical protein